jgi:hypothetical protein
MKVEFQGYLEVKWFGQQNTFNHQGHQERQNKGWIFRIFKTLLFSLFLVLLVPLVVRRVLLIGS